MLLRGLWHLCDDGIVRPVIRGEVEAENGPWVQVPFLVDTAADRTVFSADILAALRLPPLIASDRLSGVGGSAASVVVQSQIQFLREDGSPIRLHGQYAAFIEQEALDMSVLGRDITNLFAVIVDRPRDFVALLGQRHQYVIQEQ
jgi:hypothetical protein